jgi:hypothetical protein
MSLNFRRGFCGWCVRAAKCLPVVFILAVVTWSYYAYLVQGSILSNSVSVEKFSDKKLIKFRSKTSFLKIFKMKKFLQHIHQ